MSWFKKDSEMKQIGLGESSIANVVTRLEDVYEDLIALREELESRNREDMQKIEQLNAAIEKRTAEIQRSLVICREVHNAIGEHK